MLRFFPPAVYEYIYAYVYNIIIYMVENVAVAVVVVVGRNGYANSRVWWLCEIPRKESKMKKKKIIIFRVHIIV